MAKFCVMPVLCLVMTSFLLHTSLAVAPNTEKEAKSLFRDLDELTTPHPDLEYEEDPPINNELYPFLSYYKTARREGKSAALAAEEAADFLFDNLGSTDVLFYSQPENREMREKIVARIQKFIEIYRRSGAQDEKIPGFGHLNGILEKTEEFVIQNDPPQTNSTGD